MRRENLRWPAALAPIPRDQWPVDPAAARCDASVRLEAWRSRTFLAQLFDEGGMLRLSVNRTEWDERANRFRADIGWDDLQRLKAEAGFGDRAAVELFPPDVSVVNVANMRHIWLLPEPPSWMWAAPCVTPRMSRGMPDDERG